MLMRHYEITLIVHPDQSSQVTTMIEKYKEIITTSGGNVHREEDWGRKHLAYPINKIYKAHYLMMNIECDQETLDKLNYNFRFNDAILRNLIISKSGAITTPSIMMVSSAEDKEKVTNKNAKRLAEKYVENFCSILYCSNYNSWCSRCIFNSYLTTNHNCR